MRQLVLNIRPHAQLRLDNFVVGDNADLMAALGEQLTRQDGSLLYVWGGAGSGKSHLLRGAVASSEGHRSAAYHDATNWQMPVTSDGALIAIDNTDALSEAAQSDLFRLLIAAAGNQHSLLLAGNVPPRELGLRADVQSRVAQSLVFEIKPLNDTHKAATLMQHARNRGMALGEELVRYLLRHGRRDLPWLMAVLDALDEASLSLARPVTLPLLRDILRDSVEQR